jgi:predicted transcriptional regulator of viral defense system
MTLESHISHRDRIVAFLADRGMARLTEIKATGATAAAVARLEREGAIVRLGRGLYQLPDAPTDAHHALAEASKLVPRAVVCLTSALAFHDLTDRMPPKVWLAIDRADRLPRQTQPPMRFVRFPPLRMQDGYERYRIEGVDVPITDPAHTVIDMFRYRNAVGLPVAIEGLKEALRTRKASPGDLAHVAARNRTWTVVRPYLEALSHDG